MSDQAKTEFVVLNPHGQIVARFPDFDSVPDEVEDDYGEMIAVQPNNMREVPVGATYPPRMSPTPNSEASSSSLGVPAPGGEPAKEDFAELVRQVADTQFDCGDWRSDDEAPYDDLSAAADEALRLLTGHVDSLRSQLQDAQAVIQAAQEWRASYDTLPREDADHTLAEVIDAHFPVSEEGR